MDRPREFDMPGAFGSLKKALREAKGAGELSGTKF